MGRAEGRRWDGQRGGGGTGRGEEVGRAEGRRWDGQRGGGGTGRGEEVGRAEGRRWDGQRGGGGTGRGEEVGRVEGTEMEEVEWMEPVKNESNTDIDKPLHTSSERTLSSVFPAEHT